MYYGANVEAKLFMGQSTATPLPAANADTYDEVSLTGSIQPPENNLNTAFFNVTNDSQRRSLGGKLGDQTCSGNVVIDWEEDTHVAMHADSIAPGGRLRNWYVRYPTGTRFLIFRGRLSQWQEEAFDAGDEAKEHRANWSIALDGGAAAANDAPGTIAA